MCVPRFSCAERQNRRLVARLVATEEQLLAVSRDEAALDLVRALADAKVCLAEAHLKLMAREVGNGLWGGWAAA